MKMESVTPNMERRYDLDWLRALAVLLLVPFHSALVFNINPTVQIYMKDVVQSDFLVHMAGFMHRWHMPLLFFIAGAAAWLSLGFRSGGLYLKERVMRLFVPFAFCLVAFIPPMTYIHFLQSADPPSFGRHFMGFWSLNFSDLGGLGGTFTPAHLWFILFLFFFSVAALPVFTFLRGDRGKRFVNRLANVCSKPGFILVVPGLLLTLFFAIPLLGDKNPLFYIGIFLLGGLSMTDQRFNRAIDRHFHAALILGVASVVLDYVAPISGYAPWSWQWIVLGPVYIFSRWMWVVVLISAGRRLLNRTHKVLDYTVEAAYPFYLLHLPIDTLVAWFVIRLDAGIAVKYMLIVIGTICLTLGVYEVFIRRNGAMRLLFGMKSRALSTPP